MIRIARFMPDEQCETIVKLFSAICCLAKIKTHGMKKLLLLLTTLLSCYMLKAQNRTISGTVTDEKGSPLAGVTVQVKGNAIAVATDAAGAYTITVPATARVLVFSFVDKETREVNIGNQSQISLSLQSNERALQEVVVVGYGTQRKKSVTASISKIDPGPISNLVTPSIDKQLAGRAAGVQVTNPGGLLNQEPRIRIRGINSVNSNRDPLIVVDGVPFQTGGVLQNVNSPNNANAVANGNSTSSVSGVSNSTGISSVANTNPLSSINPSDIESFEVLKDGSATAIYGSRAANGVILITTKRGKQGRMNVNYNTWFGVSNTLKRYDLLNAEEFVTIANERYTNAGQAPQAVMSAERTNTDWQSVIFRRNAFAQNHSLSMDGASANTNYFLSFNYQQQDGLIITNKTKRFGIRANLAHKINDWIKIGNNLSGSRVDDNDQNNGGNALDGAIAGALRALPNVRVKDPANPTGYNLAPQNAALGQDANLRAIENNYSNPAFLLDNNIFSSEKYFVTENAFIELTPFKNFMLRSQGSFDMQTTRDLLTFDPRHGSGRGPNGRVDDIDVFRQRLLWQTYINYTLSFNKHNLFFTVGSEFQKDKYRYNFSRGTNVSDRFFLQNGIISGTFGTQQSGGGESRGGFISYFGRINYDFNTKYFAQVSFRRDGQSSLAAANRYGNFPGFSLGWRISEEGFWKNSGLAKTINEFKIRGSYAVVGNTLSGFPYLSTYGASPYASINGIGIAAVGNNELLWETNKKIDIGADISFWNDKLVFTFDYFRNNNDNLVLAAPLPSSFGIPGNSIFQNIGTMLNQGLEFSLTANVIRKGDWRWSSNLNFTTTNNEVKSLLNNQDVILPGPNSGTYNVLRVGSPINALFGYQYAGVNTANGNPMYFKQDANRTLIQGNIATTTYHTVIKADDPTLGAATTLATTDRTIIGNTVPTWFGGFDNNLAYKNFDLNIFFRFSGGNVIYNQTAQEVLYTQFFQNNGKVILNRWTKPGDVTDVPRQWAGRDNFTNLSSQASSRFVEDGDYLRLQNLSFGYNFNPAKLASATNNKIRSLRLFVQGQNLAVWTKYSGLDPDNFTEFGLDNASVPPARTFSVGLNLGF